LISLLAPLPPFRPSIRSISAGLGHRQPLNGSFGPPKGVEEEMIATPPPPFEPERGAEPPFGAQMVSSTPGSAPLPPLLSQKGAPNPLHLRRRRRLLAHPRPFWARKAPLERLWAAYVSLRARKASLPGGLSSRPHRCCVPRGRLVPVASASRTPRHVERASRQRDAQRLHALSHIDGYGIHS